jgi:hypothetical protein
MVDSEIVEKHFKDTGSGDKFKPVVAKTTTPSSDFTSPSNAFWAAANQSLLESYKSGTTVGKYGVKSPDIETFFNRLSNCIKETIMHELQRSQVTGEKYKNELAALDNILKILAEHVKIDIEGKQTDCVKSMCSHMHGFINEYSKVLADENV